MSGPADPDPAPPPGDPSDEAMRAGPESVLTRLGAGGVPRAAVLLRVEDSDGAPIVQTRSPDLKQRHEGRYQMLGEIARGGVGIVLKGRDVDLGRDVAMKVLHEKYAGKPDVLARFVEEAQIGGQLQHPGIVPVYELGLRADDRPYFTMKLIKGKTLAFLLQERPDPGHERRRFLSIFEAVCQTMAYAHARGVIHRDLKPSNVMVGAFGEVQVVDWGLAKVLPRGGVADEMPVGAAPPPDMSVIATVRSGSTGSGPTSPPSRSGPGPRSSPPPRRGSGPPRNGARAGSPPPWPPPSSRSCSWAAAGSSGCSRTAPGASPRRTGASRRPSRTRAGSGAGRRSPGTSSPGAPRCRRRRRRTPSRDRPRRTGRRGPGRSPSWPGSSRRRTGRRPPSPGRRGTGPCSPGWRGSASGPRTRTGATPRRRTRPTGPPSGSSGSTRTRWRRRRRRRGCSGPARPCPSPSPSTTGPWCAARRGGAPPGRTGGSPGSPRRWTRTPGGGGCARRGTTGPRSGRSPPPRRRPMRPSRASSAWGRRSATRGKGTGPSPSSSRPGPGIPTTSGATTRWPGWSGRAVDPGRTSPSCGPPSRSVPGAARCASYGRPAGLPRGTTKGPAASSRRRRRPAPATATSWPTSPSSCAAAARFHTLAFGPDGAPAEGVDAAQRYDAACALALAGTGEGGDAASSDEASRSPWRSRALACLQAELEDHRRRMRDPSTYSPGGSGLPHWKEDPDLRGVRDPGALEKLPPAERSAWRALWTGVDSLLGRAPTGR